MLAQLGRDRTGLRRRLAEADGMAERRGPPPLRMLDLDQIAVDPALRVGGDLRVVAQRGEALLLGPQPLAPLRGAARTEDRFQNREQFPPALFAHGGAGETWVLEQIGPLDRAAEAGPERRPRTRDRDMAVNRGKHAPEAGDQRVAAVGAARDLPGEQEVGELRRLRPDLATQQRDVDALALSG